MHTPEIAIQPLPRETLFMLISVHLQNKINENDYFESMVEIPRTKVGERQTIETLTNEEALLFAKYLRNEKDTWQSRTAIVWN